MTTTPTWAWAKIGRARALASQCDAVTAQWAGLAHPRPKPKIAKDRLWYDVRIRIERPFPLEELALLTGDCIHNLRSALNVAVWSSARPEELATREREALGFPLVTDPAKWAEVASRRLKTVSDPIVDRIAEVQPFQRPADERDRDGLLALHRLDIQDKHRLALATRVTLAEMSLDSQVEFRDEAAASRNVPPAVTMHECPLEDGGLVLTHRTIDPIVKIRGAFSLQWQVGMEVDGRFESASALLGGLAGLVTQVLGHVWPG